MDSFAEKISAYIGFIFLKVKHVSFTTILSDLKMNTVTIFVDSFAKKTSSYIGTISLLVNPVSFTTILGD